MQCIVHIQWRWWTRLHCRYVVNIILLCIVLKFKVFSSWSCVTYRQTTRSIARSDTQCKNLSTICIGRNWWTVIWYTVCRGLGNYVCIVCDIIIIMYLTLQHTSLFSMHLYPLLYLTPYWSTPLPRSLEDNTTEQLTMMEIMEKRLATFIKLKWVFRIITNLCSSSSLNQMYYLYRYEERCTDVARQQKRWNEFAQELVQHA